MCNSVLLCISVNSATTQCRVKMSWGDVDDDDDDDDDDDPLSCEKSYYNGGGLGRVRYLAPPLLLSRKLDTESIILMMYRWRRLIAR